MCKVEGRQGRDCWENAFSNQERHELERGSQRPAQETGGGSSNRKKEGKDEFEGSYSARFEPNANWETDDSLWFLNLCFYAFCQTGVRPKK